MRKKAKKKRTKRTKVEEWLIDNQKLFNITGIERELMFPKGTLHKFLKYRRRLTEESIEILDTKIKDMVYSYIDNE